MSENKLLHSWWIIKDYQVIEAKGYQRPDGLWCFPDPIFLFLKQSELFDTQSEAIVFLTKKLNRSIKFYQQKLKELELTSKDAS